MIDHYDNYISSRVFNFELHRREAIEAYRRVRPQYVEFADVLRRIVREALTEAQVHVSLVEARAKDLESLGSKAAEPAESDPEKPKYPGPLTSQGK